MECDILKLDEDLNNEVVEVVTFRNTLMKRGWRMMRIKEQMVSFKFQLGYYKSKGQGVSRGTKWVHEGVHLGQPNITRRVWAKSSL